MLNTLFCKLYKIIFYENAMHSLITVLTYGSSFAQFTSDMNFTDIYGNTLNSKYWIGYEAK